MSVLSSLEKVIFFKLLVNDKINKMCDNSMTGFIQNSNSTKCILPNRGPSLGKLRIERLSCVIVMFFCTACTSYLAIFQRNQESLPTACACAACFGKASTSFSFQASWLMRGIAEVVSHVNKPKECLFGAQEMHSFFLYIDIN